jgi:hypothetical protein
MQRKTPLRRGCGAKLRSWKEGTIMSVEPHQCINPQWGNVGLTGVKVPLDQRATSLCFES